MAFQTGTSTSIDNLMAILSTFLQANGWTEDDVTTGVDGRMSMSKNSMFVHFQWTESGATSGTGALAIYQSLGYINSGTSKWLHTDDSGAGAASATTSQYDQGRCVNNFAGPHTNYWFFEQDTSPAYVHVVVEVDANRYRHFGFGELNKIGDWTGGEYCYGHYWGQSASEIDNPVSNVHSACFDQGSSISQTRLHTIHVEDHVNEPDANTKWAVMGDSESTPGNDRNGTARWTGRGGSRGGPYVEALGHFSVSSLNAFKPLIPVVVWLKSLLVSPNARYMLGFQPDVAVMNIANLDPASTYVIGADTWYVFPWVRKQKLESNTEESWNGGWAYKRVDA